MEPGLGLEERTDRLLRRSAALLQRGPAPRASPAPAPVPAPSSDPVLSGDPLIQWRLRRRAEPCWTSRDPWEAAGPLQRMPSSRSRDAKEALRPIKDSSHDTRQRSCWRSGEPCSSPQPIRKGSQEPPWGQPCWMSRVPWEASMPMEGCCHDALRPMREDSHEPLPPEPPLRSHGPHEAPLPIRSSSQESLWGQSCWTSLDSVEPSRPKEGNSHEPLQQVPCVRSHDCCEATQPIRSCSQDALCQGSPLEEHSASLEEPSLRTRDPQEAPQPISSSTQDALQPLKDNSHAALVDPILRLLRRRRRLLWQSLRAVDSTLAALQDQSH